MYKKAILAASVAGVATQGHAASWNLDELIAVTHVDENLSSITNDTVDVSDGVLKLGVEYAQNDLITFTSSVEKASNATWPTSITSVSQPATVAPIITCKINNASQAKASTTLTLDACNFSPKVGEYISIAGDDGLYRIKTQTSATSVAIGAPGLLVAAADDALVTVYTRKRVQLTMISNDATSATYRVSATPDAVGTDGNSASAATSTVGALIPFATPNLKATALMAADTATLSSSAQTGAGAAMDTNATTFEVAKTVAGYTFTADTIFDAQVSVDLSRKSFVGPSQVDILRYTTAASAGVDGVDSTSTAVTAGSPTLATTTVSVATTSWSFMDTNTTSAGIQLDANNTAASTNGTVAFSTDGTTLTIADTAVRANNSLTITKAAGATSNDLPAQTYTATAAYTATPTNGTATVYTPASISAGAWTLNAASITAYGVPYGSSVSRFLWVNNSGSTAGDISATFVQGGVSTDLGSIGTAATLSSTEIGSLIDAALTANSITPAANSRANVIVTVTSPANEITMTSAYKVTADGDRLALENSDTIDGTGK